jgi:type I restriction enzyme M protein
MLAGKAELDSQPNAKIVEETVRLRLRMSNLRQQLEQQLWQAMDQAKGLVPLRDSLEYLLGLLFLKYLSDQRGKESPEHSGPTDSAGDSGGASIRIPVEVRWDQLVASMDLPGPQLVRTIYALRDYPDSHGIGEQLIALGLLKLADQPKRLCYELLHIVDQVDLDSVKGNDLADVYVRFLERYADAAGARSGEFYTPHNLSVLMAELLAPEPGSSIYDPACGTGGLLLAAYRLTEPTGSDSDTLLFGQEINPQTAALAKIHMTLRGLSASLATGNTLLDPCFVEGSHVKQFDYIVANPPIGVRLNDSELWDLRNDPYHRFISPIPKMADYAFIQHIVASLSKQGRAAILVGLRTLFVSGREGEIRKWLIQQDVIEAVITLPRNLLPNTSAPTAIVILNRAKPESLRDRILFVYADEEYESENRKRNTIGEQNRRKIVQIVRQPQGKHRFAIIATRDQVAAYDYFLMPASYIDLIGIDSFMGGEVRWIELDEVADVFQGTRLGRQSKDAGVTPAIQGRDLSVAGLEVDDLAKVDVPSDITNAAYSEVGDILIQRIGQSPKVHLVEDDLKGVLVRDTVYVIRFHEKDPARDRYLVEFLNSNVGQGLLSTGVGGAVIPTLRLTDLRRLRVPIPDRAVVELVNNLHEVERSLIGRINHTRDLRQRLFSIEDPEQASIELRNLSTEAQVLGASLVQVDDLDFQLRNFYPFPLVYAFRVADAIDNPAILYKEQLRIAENILAFLGSIGLVLAAHIGILSAPSNANLTRDFLQECWQGGMSPGDWRTLAIKAGSAMRGNRSFAVVEGFASLWFKGSGRRASKFANLTRQLVELKNIFKHDKEGSPIIPQEYEQAAQRINSLFRQCFNQLAFFIQHPIRLVRHVDIEWKTEKAILDTLVYVGDHPGLRQEQVVRPAPLPTGKLYLEATDAEWVPLHPLMSIHYCPKCQSRETFMIDYWDGPGERVVLKSFERGHTFENDETARAVGADLAYWIGTQLPSLR